MLLGNINAIPFRRRFGGGGGTPFPFIPGMIARYSGAGLTNEDMSKNPVWKDLMGNGYDLQMKNFLWGGMSGVGGYKLNWGDSSIWVNYITQGERGTGEVTDNIIHITSVKLNYVLFETRASLKSVEYKVLIKGLTDDIYLRYGVFNDGKELWTEIKNDGIYTLPSYDYDSKFNMKWKVMSQTYPIDCNITIEQLPLYPGALVFDGVDDYGICDNFPILTKEKGYTVVALRQWIEEKNSITALVSNSKNWNKDGAFVFEYNNLENNYPNLEISFGNNTNLGREKSSFTYQTSKLYNGKEIESGEFLGSDKLIVAKANENLSPCSNVAIWEIVILDHDATEEELTKIKDYFVKTYPWLFPDQGWTVTGKTNEDEDRATIANITGNGNDFVLSNFGFAEGSGYNEEGEYAGYLVTDGVDDRVVSRSFTLNKDWTIVGNWKMLQPEANKLSGIVKQNSLFIYNYVDGLNISINDAWNFFKLKDIRSVNAICSDGRIYLNDWTEIIDSKQQTVNESVGALVIGILGNVYTSLAFKNLGIYNNQILSKDDCIKAYNYLQTLKAK
jgi:hypothetical protein